MNKILLVLIHYYSETIKRGVNDKVNNIKNQKREVTLILVNIMVLTLFFSGKSIYMKTKGKIAQPQLVVEKSSIIQMNESMN